MLRTPLLQVEVVNGPHKGKQGAVVSVIRDQNKLIVENINMVRLVHSRFVWQRAYTLGVCSTRATSSRRPWRPAARTCRPARSTTAT